MKVFSFRWRSLASALLLFVSTNAAADIAGSRSHVEDALSNITTLDRPGQDGFATIWDGNKYIQCRRLPDRTFRCEAAGTLLQPSLAHIITADRIARLEKLGWRLDASFGNYVQIFPADMAQSQIVDKILETLKQGYDAGVNDLEVRTDWIKSQPCPPRNGPTQNLAGMINDAPAMAVTAIHGCSYKPSVVASVQSVVDLVKIYGPRATGEIQRLRVNAANDKVFVIFDTTAGYLQCRPSPSEIYCEAQSADSWPMLASILTPDRVARLHAAGYADPGRSPNYWRTYALDKFDDTAIARDLLTILYQVYGYHGAPQLKIKTEKGPA